jgi:hypothetical protein
MTQAPLKRARPSDGPTVADRSRTTRSLTVGAGLLVAAAIAVGAPMVNAAPVAAPTLTPAATHLAIEAAQAAKPVPSPRDQARRLYLRSKATRQQVAALQAQFGQAIVPTTTTTAPQATTTTTAPAATTTTTAPAATTTTTAPAATTTTTAAPRPPAPAPAPAPAPVRVAAPAPRPAAPAAAPAPAVSDGSTWDRLAQCESGGNWASNTGNGYYGGIQFSLSSWQAVGGTGLPSQASREQQIAMGERLRASQGWGAWPACSRKLGLR